MRTDEDDETASCPSFQIVVLKNSFRELLHFGLEIDDLMV